MTQFIILLVVTIFLFIVSIKVTKGELFACSSITLLSLIFAIALLFIISAVWRVELSSKSVWILCCAFVSLTLGDLLAYRRNKPVYTTIYSPCYIRIKYNNFLLFVYIVATALYALEIKRLGASIGFNDLHAIGEVKDNMEELNSQMNPFIKQMYKVVTASSYLHSLIFANNVFLAKSRWTKELKHLTPFICTVVITLASGGRLNIFKVMVGAIFIIYMILRESSYWKEKYFSKIIKIGLPLIIGFILLFSAVGLIVKANASERNEINTFEYTAYYAGSPILVFDIKLNDGVKKWTYDRFGNYTLSGIYKILGLEKDKQSKNIGNGMVYLGGFSDSGGNAMTIFGGLYFDFGLIGMCIVLFLTYYYFSRYYYRNILKSYSSYQRNKKLMVYTYCYVSLIVMAFYDSCYYILLSTTGLLTLAVLLIMYWVYFKKLIIVHAVR